jgi:hypothetical protein
MASSLATVPMTSVAAAEGLSISINVLEVVDAALTGNCANHQGARAGHCIDVQQIPLRISNKSTAAMVMLFHPSGSMRMGVVGSLPLQWP